MRPTRSLLLLLALSPALAAQEGWLGRWRLVGKDGQGLYAGTAEVVLEGGALRVRSRVQAARREGGALVAEGPERALSFRGAPSGSTLAGSRPGGPGAAGTVGGGGQAAVPGRFERRDGLLIGTIGPAREVLWDLAGDDPSPALALAALEATRAGDWGRPYEASAFPFFHAATTVGRASAAARYQPRPDLSEAGPEVVYRLSLAARSKVTAWVQGDAGAVDVDVHLLSSLRLDPTGLARGCLARGNAVAEAELPAGTAYVAVDTFQGPGKAGPYRLRIDVQPLGEWYERPVARGVTLRTRPYPDLFGARQHASVLVVDPRVEGVRVEPLGGGGCQRPGDRARAAGAIAALNAGFFGPGCGSVSLLKVGGQLLAPNRVTRSALGIDAQGRLHIDRIEAGRDWPAMTHAVGGVPRVVRGGKAVDETAQEGTAGASPPPATRAAPRGSGATGGCSWPRSTDGRRPARA